MKKKIRELTGNELDAAVAIGLGRPVVCLRDLMTNQPRLLQLKSKLLEPSWMNTEAIAPFSSDGRFTTEFMEKYKICVDAGDGSFKGDRKWSAWRADQAPVMADEEITGPDVRTAVARCVAIKLLCGEEVDLP